jgi:hypothetical protein
MEDREVGPEEIVETEMGLKITKAQLDQLCDLAKKDETPDDVATRLIQEKLTESPRQVAINDAVVTALELALQHCHDNEEPSDVKKEIAGDLIVARASLEAAKTGTINPKNIKKWAIELFA